MGKKDWFDFVINLKHLFDKSPRGTWQGQQSTSNILGETICIVDDRDRLEIYSISKTSKTDF